MENKIEVVYTKAKLLKRMGAHFIDLGLTFLTAMLLFAIFNPVITGSGFYKAKQNELIQLRNESGLYENNVLATTYVENEELFPSFKDRKNFLSERIDEFYSNTTYFTDDTIIKEYDQRKLDATVVVESTTIHLFIKSGDNIIENNVSDESLFNFYKGEIEDTSLAYLVRNSRYFNLTRFSFWVTIIEIIVFGTFAFTVYYLVMPLAAFRRGRQTIGMKLEKIGLINVEAENIGWGIYTLRFIFMYVVFLLLDFVGFLIPALVSLGMMYFSKTNSSLVNYVFNDYMVDVTDQMIYFGAWEREESEIKLQEMSIENKDFELK